MRNFVVLSLTVLLAPMLVQATPLLNLPAYPVTANQNPFTATQSLLTIVLTGVGTGWDVQDYVPYLGWCAEREDTSYVLGDTVVRLYASLDPNTPSQGNLALPGSMVSNNWPKINYMLNHKQGTVDDVQYVIWYYVNGGSVNGLSPTAATSAMIADADLNGGSFYPSVAQKIAVILFQDGRGGLTQDTFIEVTLTAPEPGTLATFLGASSLLLAFAWRQRKRSRPSPRTWS